jgi:hypothetical protein
MVSSTIKPHFDAAGFTCPHCNVYAKQIFEDTYVSKSDLFYSRLEKIYSAIVDDLYLLHNSRVVHEISISFCEHCHKYCIWVNKELVYPESTVAPLPCEDMPSDVKEDFLEARSVVMKSPRSAAALLRLSLQKLMPHLGMKGKNLDEDIRELCCQGISKELQEALDVVRVIGNESVHPGELDMRDDFKTALLLFDTLNWVVESTISPRKRTKDLLQNKIPKSKLANIENRGMLSQKKIN